MTKKTTAIFTMVFLLFTLSSRITKAQEQFYIDINVEYKVKNSGITTVTHNVNLENAFSNIYATSYSLTLNNISPQNPKAFQASKQLELEKIIKDETTLLKINFDDHMVGKGEKRAFSVTFEEDGFAERTGEVWEIAIPRLSEQNSFRSYGVSLLIPTSFGQEAYFSPNPILRTTEGEYYKYVFKKEAVAKSGISAGFGQFQVFSFNLNYHLENPLSKRASVDVALPPDTAFQKVYFEKLDPVPTNVRVDEDGNWLANYVLGPRERIDAVAAGSVQIFSQPREFPVPSQETLNKNLSAAKFWQTNDPQITDLAQSLKTPKAIYDYVINTLSYNYERVKPNISRLGAKDALLNPNQAICMEFTDLFIAISRAAGIPAREINGYAYTENPEIQPLSLVADVLHAWPEYWDNQRQVWIPIDPTWGSTTNGVDFFNKLDLRHFTFVIHGQNSIKPFPPGSYKLGPNPQKDVFVNFGQLPQVKNSKPEITAQPQKSLPFTNSVLLIEVKNPGPSALYNLTPEIYFEENLVKDFYIKSLPPYATETIKIDVPFSFLGIKTPEKVTVLVADSRVEAPTFKTQVIIYNLLALFLAITIIVIFAVFKLKKITLKTVAEKVKGIFRKNEQITKTTQSQTDQDKNKKAP